LGQRHQSPPAIDGIFLAPQQAPLHTALDQKRGAVVAELQPLGDLADAHGRIRGVATHDEQQHVLLRGDATRAGLLLRIAQEAPDGVAKVGMVAVIRVAEQGVLWLAHWRTTSSPRVERPTPHVHIVARCRRLVQDTGPPGPSREGRTRCTLWEDGPERGRSSVVEQRTFNPLAVGSNPTALTPGYSLTSVSMSPLLQP